MGTAAGHPSRLHRPAPAQPGMETGGGARKGAAGPGEKAFIKSSSCPFSPFALLLSPLYQLVPVNVSFAVSLTEAKKHLVDNNCQLAMMKAVI